MYLIYQKTGSSYLDPSVGQPFPKGPGLIYCLFFCHQDVAQLIKAHGFFESMGWTDFMGV